MVGIAGTVGGDAERAVAAEHAGGCPRQVGAVNAAAEGDDDRIEAGEAIEKAPSSGALARPRAWFTRILFRRRRPRHRRRRRRPRRPRRPRPRPRPPHPRRVVFVLVVGDLDFVGAQQHEVLAALGATEGVALFVIGGLDLVEFTLGAGRHTDSMRRRTAASLSESLHPRRMRCFRRTSDYSEIGEAIRNERAKVVDGKTDTQT